MAQEFRPTQMEINMKECSSKEREMARVYIIQPMVPYIRENGSMVELKAREFANGRTEENTRALGQTIKNMDMVFTLGPMEESTRVTINTIRNTGLGLTHGQMVENTLENGKMTKDTEEVSIS